jgi:hypothetical protein
VRPPSRFKEFTTIGADGYYENALAGVIEDEIISTEEYHVMITIMTLGQTDMDLCCERRA